MVKILTENGTKYLYYINYMELGNQSEIWKRIQNPQRYTEELVYVLHT